MQPLRSGFVTNLHRYYGLLRLCVPHRYSHPCGASTWISPLTSERQIPTFHTKSLNQVHATFMPDAIEAVSRMSPRLILTSSMPPVLTSTNYISTPHQWLTCAHLSDSHLTCFHAFSLTLTTPALNRCSLRWFRACFCKPTPRGLPSSFRAASWRTLLVVTCYPRDSKKRRRI